MSDRTPGVSPAADTNAPAVLTAVVPGVRLGLSKQASMEKEAIVPIILGGMALYSGYNAIQSARKGNWGDAALNAAMAIPGVGTVGRGIGMGIKGLQAGGRMLRGARAGSKLLSGAKALPGAAWNMTKAAPGKAWNMAKAAPGAFWRHGVGGWGGAAMTAGMMGAQHLLGGGGGGPGGGMGANIGGGMGGGASGQKGLARVTLPGSKIGGGAKPAAPVGMKTAEHFEKEAFVPLPFAGTGLATALSLGFGGMSAMGAYDALKRGDLGEAGLNAAFMLPIAGYAGRGMQYLGKGLNRLKPGMGVAINRKGTAYQRAVEELAERQGEGLRRGVFDTALNLEGPKNWKFLSPYGAGLAATVAAPMLAGPLLTGGGGNPSTEYYRNTPSGYGAHALTQGISVGSLGSGLRDYEELARVQS